MKENLINMKDELDQYKQRTNTQIIVTALIITVTCTVGYATNKEAFIPFIVSDALALLLSMSSLFLYIITFMYEIPTMCPDSR